MHDLHVRAGNVCEIARNAGNRPLERKVLAKNVGKMVALPEKHIAAGANARIT